MIHVNRVIQLLNESLKHHEFQQTYINKSNIDYNELKAKADKWDEKETLFKPTNLFYGGEETEGDCKCGQSVSKEETYCHACGQKLDWESEGER